jgi:raffinose/stachyose/melibiose transport system substrate-binding protein
MEVLNDCGLQPAATYAELKAQVPVLKAKGYETVIMPNKDTWVMQSCLFSAIAGRLGGEGWEKMILSGQAKFTDPDFVAALNFVKSLYDDGVIQRSAVGIEYGEGPGLFANKKSAYYIDGDWRTGAFITDSSTGQALISPDRQSNIKIGVFPDIEAAKLNSSSSVILGVGYGMSSAIPAGSAKEAAAWELVKWMTGKEVSQLRTEHGGTPTPSRTDLDFNAMKLEPMQKTIANIGNEFKTATVVIDGVFPSEAYNPINTGLIEIAMGKRTPAQVAADVQKAFDTWKESNK